MRVLLDEQLDHRLKRAFDSAFDVWTVADCGWKARKMVSCYGLQPRNLMY